MCDPTNKNAYHREGGLVVITSVYPEDIVPRGTGNRQTVERDDVSTEIVGLPTPDKVITVCDDAEDAVIVFPNEECC